MKKKNNTKKPNVETRTKVFYDGKQKVEVKGEVTLHNLYCILCDKKKATAHYKDITTRRCHIECEDCGFGIDVKDIPYHKIGVELEKVHVANNKHLVKSYWEKVLENIKNEQRPIVKSVKDFEKRPPVEHYESCAEVLLARRGQKARDGKRMKELITWIYALEYAIDKENIPGYGEARKDLKK